MLYCFNCNRTFESGKYCRYCGSLLKTKVINYETTSILMRSNLNVENIESPDMQSILPPVQPVYQEVPVYEQPPVRNSTPVSQPEVPVYQPERLPDM
ncbi:MAG: hypothetical protein MR434_02030, partial [Ruminococcus sp.]|nr:hypothetical protein [Ruminococcus sp.]